MRPITVAVGQIRVCAEVLHRFAADKTANNLAHHYSGCRPEINAFLEKHSSRAALDVCVQDLKDVCRVDRYDTLDEVLMNLSFQEAPMAMIVFMNDLASWKNVSLVLKTPESSNYVVLDPSTASLEECALLDVDVKDALSRHEAKEGYLVWSWKNKPTNTIVENKAAAEEEPKSAAPAPTPKKRSRITKKSSAAIEVTSEESTRVGEK